MAQQGRRALLVGCPWGTLVGVRNSIEALRLALERHGFECIVMCGPEVTAAVLIAALTDFVDATKRGDSVVIVYVGHGEVFERETPGVPYSGPDGVPRVLHALLPTDYAQSTATQCNVLTSLDIVPLLETLAEVATSVVLILDCCHAAGLVAGSTVDLAANEYYHRMIGERAAQRRRSARGLLLEGLSDRDAAGGLAEIVRLVASPVTGLALEIPYGKDGETIGAFSFAVATGLGASGEYAAQGQPNGREIAWLDLAAAIHGLMCSNWAAVPLQWSGVEGPRDRILFRRDRLPLGPQTCTCAAAQDGSLMIPVPPGSFRVGEEVALIEPAGGLVATSQVAEVAGAWGRLALSATATALAEVPFVRVVRIERSGALRVEVADEVAARLGSLPPGWSAASGERTARITVDAGEVRVDRHDPRSAIVVARLDDPQAAAAIVAGLLRIGEWRRTERAVEAASWRPVEREFLATVTRMATGSPIAVGGEVTEGERLVVSAAHAGDLWTPLHCDVFRVCADLEIKHLTRDAAHGVVVAKGPPEPLWSGRIEWCSVPRRDGPRDECLLILVHHRPLYMHSLATALTSRPATRALETTTRSGGTRGPWCLMLRYRLRPAPDGDSAQ